MFLNELTPLWQELAGQPLSFLGGVCAGLLRLDPNEDPLKSWLARETSDPPAG